MIDVATLSVIRRWALREHLSIREIARRTGLSRNTIRKYLRSDVVQPQLAQRTIAAKLDPFTSKLSGWLRTEATIVSQIHNFFIHRLVNERDLMLLDNTISTLDSSSKALIPTLAKGCCVVTGTAFDLPMILKIDPLLKQHRPSSDDVNLEELWAMAST